MKVNPVVLMMYIQPLLSPCPEVENLSLCKSIPRLVSVFSSVFSLSSANSLATRLWIFAFLYYEPEVHLLVD